MANRLSMAIVNAILSLHQSGHSNRRIAKLLGVDRETVGKYLGQGSEDLSNRRYITCVAQ
jgi:DNA-binding CsgD family transcriptional regulator